MSLRPRRAEQSSCSVRWRSCPLSLPIGTNPPRLPYEVRSSSIPPRSKQGTEGARRSFPSSAMLSKGSLASSRRFPKLGELADAAILHEFANELLAKTGRVIPANFEQKDRSSLNATRARSTGCWISCRLNGAVAVKPFLVLLSYCLLIIFLNKSIKDVRANGRGPWRRATRYNKGL